MGRRSSWLEGIVRAGGAALVVPFGLLLAVAVAASVGGGSFGGLGQLVAGPEVPAAGAGGVTSTSGRPSDAGVPRLPAADGRARRARGTTSSADDGATSAGGTRAPRGRTVGPDGRRSTGTRGRRRIDPPSTRRPDVPPPAPDRPAATPDPAPAPAATTPAPAQGAPAPTTPEPPAQNPVRRIGAAVDGVVRPLPVVGPPVADAVGTVVDLVAPPPQG